MALDLPVPGGDAGTWDEKLNAALTQLDAEKLATSTAATTYATQSAVSGKVDKAVAASDRGATAAFLGDSITDLVGGGALGNWTTFLPAMLGGQIINILNAGISGNTTAQMLARVPDVVAVSPRYCFVLGGANDDTAATTRTNLKAIFTALRNADIEPIACYMVPNNNAGRLPIIAEVNTWLDAYCARNRMIALDVHTAISDVATGNFLTGTFVDGTHPNQYGHVLMARAAAKQLDGKLGTAWTPRLASNAAAPRNLIGDGLFTAAVGGVPGVPGDWTALASGSAASYTYSLVDDAAFARGKVQRLVRQAGSIGFLTLRKTVSSGVAGGDRIKVALRSRSTGYEASPQAHFQVKVAWTGAAGTAMIANQWSADISGTIYGEVVAPAGATGFLLDITDSTTASRAAATTWDVAQVTVENLTAVQALVA